MSTLEKAKKLLRSHLAKEYQDIIVAVDLDGEPGCHSVMSWDSNSGKSSEDVLSRLEALPSIAEQGLSNCCKDISNAGLLGTVSIMMENSGKGAIIDIERIPIPAGIGILPWCLSFQGYGFVLSADKKDTAKILEIFKNKNIAASIIGHVTKDRKVLLKQNNQEEVLFDFASEKITGISCINEY